MTSILICHYPLPDGFVPHAPMHTDDLEGGDGTFELTQKGRVVSQDQDTNHHGALRFQGEDQEGNMHEYRALFDRGSVMALVGGRIRSEQEQLD